MKCKHSRGVVIGGILIQGNQTIRVRAVLADRVKRFEIMCNITADYHTLESCIAL